VNTRTQQYADNVQFYVKEKAGEVYKL